MTFKKSSNVRLLDELLELAETALMLMDDSLGLNLFGHVVTIANDGAQLFSLLFRPRLQVPGNCRQVRQETDVQTQPDFQAIATGVDVHVQCLADAARSGGLASLSGDGGH